jgi:ferric-dicitrate binding protein FerR (iron transport regulator)
MTQVNPEHMNMEDDILISYLLGEASTAEIKQVDLRRRTDEAYNKRFEAFKLLWETSKNLEDTKEADKQASLKRFKEKVIERKVTNTRIIKLKQSNIWMTIAASLMFIAGGAWLYYNQFIDHQMRFETQGIVKTDTLPDGSRITLNKYALLSYPEKFGGDRRNVTLVKGEGFFNITPNKAKPFMITTGKTTISVVGTSFNVKNKNGWIEVIVETGIVQVSNNWNNTMIALKPGEMALVHPQTGKIIKLKTPDNLYAYFRSDEFVFKNVTLYRLVQVLNEAYDSHIIIDKSVSKNQIMTGSLKTKDPLDVILNVISVVLNIKVEKTPNQIILKK